MNAQDFKYFMSMMQYSIPGDFNPIFADLILSNLHI